MTEPTELRAQIEALEGGAFLDTSALRVLAVRGPDARKWLGDLVTADVATLEPGSARRSLLLTPTGRIRADFTMLATADGFLLVQADDQPERAGDILAPYVLSSAVELEDATTQLAVDATADDDLDVARIRRGDPRMGVDFDAGALPAEAGLGSAIDEKKGCFLGQEAVAKVRNLGHPPTVLRHLRSAVEVSRDASVHTPGGVVGTVTSAAPAADGGWILLARVGWEAAEAALETAGGTPLTPA